MLIIKPGNNFPNIYIYKYLSLASFYNLLSTKRERRQ